jgi:hypothetical protein
VVFVIINVFPWIVWAGTGAGFPWPIFVMGDDAGEP